MITTMVEDCANSAENLTLATDGPTISGNPVAVFETTMGTFKAELFTDQAPITACNFAKLIESEFFDGLIFHRVIYEVVPDDGRAPFKFVIQGGDPNCNKVAPGELAPAGQGCGEGGAEETIPLEIVPELRHDSAGILSMARTNDPNSATSQFFVTLGPVPFLDDNYAVYGKVFEGLDIVDTIGQVETGEGDRPVENVVMTKVYLEV
jgi:peptidyl-prolyl cis-trans isomerase A (cyclophilin A)